MQPNENAYAACVIVVTPQGIPLVQNPEKPPPIFWKFPGGGKDATETPEDCAIRELKEETGISLSASQLVLVCKEDRGTHLFFLFRADLLALPELKQQGDEGENIRVFNPHEILGMPDFLPPHLRMGQEVLEQLL